MIALGSRYRDTVTGFTGIATGWAEYLYGSPDVRITAQNNQEDEKQRWIAEQRLELLADDSKVGF